MLAGIFLTLLLLAFIVPCSIAFGVWVKRVSRFPDVSIKHEPLITVKSVHVEQISSQMKP